MTDEPTPIPGFPGYFITRQADVFSTVGNGKGNVESPLRQLRPSPGGSRSAYRYVTLAYGPKGDRKHKRIGVHVLVLQTFVGPCPEGCETRHLDGVSTNNTSDNLAWGTRKENMNDKVRHGTDPRGEMNPRALLTEGDVIEIRKRFARGESPPSLTREFPVTYSQVKLIIYRKSWMHVPVDAETEQLIVDRLAGKGLGESHHASRLTEDDVRAIRRRHAAGGVTFAQLGDEYGIAKGNIKRVVDRDTWKHVV